MASNQTTDVNYVSKIKYGQEKQKRDCNIKEKIRQKTEQKI